MTLTIPSQLSGNKEEITVHGSGPTMEGNTVVPAVNKTEPRVGNYMVGLTVTYLPSLSRDLTQVAACSSIHADAFGVVIAGQRATAAHAAEDGANFNDPLLDGPRGSRDGRLFLPQTTRI